MSLRRVLVDARLSWGSGIGRYVSNIVSAVADRLDSCTLTLLVAPGDIDRARAATAGRKNIAIEETSIRPFSFAEQRLLPRLAAGYDLTWFTNYWVPLRWKGKFVATVHDVIHLQPDFPASPGRRLAAARTFAKVRKDASHILFVSRFTARQFEAKVGAPNTATVIHHGIDHCDMGKIASLTRQKFALVVSAAKEHKNLAILLDAWRAANLPGWRLMIVTPAGGLLSSINLTEQAKAIPTVEIRRGVSDGELNQLYAQAGFVIVPSRYEGFGLPLLEAMLAGAPVVSSTAQALVEVAAGALIPFVSPEDREGWIEAIRRMAADCGLSSNSRSEILEQNATWARTFTWEKAARSTASVLYDALKL